MNTINNTLKKVVDALEDKKAEDIRLIDISEVSTIADYFVITKRNKYKPDSGIIRQCGRET